MLNRSESPITPEVPCKWCGKMTLATAIEECPRCWNVRVAVERDASVVAKILEETADRFVVLDYSHVTIQADFSEIERRVVGKMMVDDLETQVVNSEERKAKLNHWFARLYGSSNDHNTTKQGELTDAGETSQVSTSGSQTGRYLEDRSVEADLSGDVQQDSPTP